MEQKEENKIEIKDKIFNFYNTNKLKIYLTVIILIIACLLFIYVNHNNVKKNILIAEKYVEAGFNLSSNEKDKALRLYEEIIESKNNIYSILSLNILIEKGLETDEKKILNYFKTIEKLEYSQDSKDLVNLKKGLYLIKKSKNLEGKKILQNLIDKNSIFANLAKEVIED